MFILLHWVLLTFTLIFISNTKIPYTDLKLLINKFIIKKWQKSWDDQTQNKLHHI